MDAGFSVSGIFQKMYPMADRSWRLTIDTGELSPNDVAVMYALNKMPVLAVISPDMVEVEKIYEIKNIKKEQSASSIQREIIYERWKNHGAQGEFRDYYESRMREIAAAERAILEKEKGEAIQDF